MKTPFLIASCCLILLFNNIYAQEYFNIGNAMRSPNADFKSICEQAEQFYSQNTHDQDEGGGFISFKRWETFWKTRINNDLNQTNSFSKYIDALNSVFNIDPICQGTDLSNWELLGRTLDCPEPPVPNLGIITTVCTDPQNSDIVFIGGNTAGLWKTNSINASSPYWTCLTDQTRLAGLGVQSIVIDHSNSQTIYIGTGLGSINGGG